MKVFTNNQDAARSVVQVLKDRSLLLILAVNTRSRYGQLEYPGNCLLKIITYSVDSSIHLGFYASPIHIPKCSFDSKL